jgi:hypothetical protein
MVDFKLKRALEQCVSGGRCQFLTYKEFGTRFGFGPRGPRKEALDAGARDFTNNDHLPDLTFLLRNATSGYPSQIDFRPAKPKPDDTQKAKAKAEAQKIIDMFCPGTKNPYAH